MKNPLLIFTLLFSTVFFSSPSYAKWTKVVEVQGNTFYVDFDKIKKNNGYVYFWQLVDLSKPTKQGVLSDKSYLQGSCKLLQFKSLSFSSYKKPMGGETPSESSNEPDKKWIKTPPNSAIETILKSVCSR
jgi:hypothetical protein